MSLLIGPNITLTHLRPEFAAGQAEIFLNRSYIYGRAATALAANAATNLDASFATTAGATYTAPSTGIAINEWGWFARAVTPF